MDWFISPLEDKALSGSISIPGDKSISHRAHMLLAISEGEASIQGALRSEDVAATEAAISKIFSTNEFSNGEFIECDCGNSGTTIRLLMGLLSAGAHKVRLTGDESLTKRPMERVAKPLRELGANIETSDGTPPVEICGGELTGANISVPIASAQIKSALLLAGLGAKGETRITMPGSSRDHTERMLKYLGAKVDVIDGGSIVAIQGGQKLIAVDIDVPGDISSAAFFIVAGLIVPQSSIKLMNVGTNHSRTGILTVIERSGSNTVVRINEREECGELRADLSVSATSYNGFSVLPEEIPSLIDEIPILALYAALSEEGDSKFVGAQELKVKETNRMAAIIEEFDSIGLSATCHGDDLHVPGGQVVEGGSIESRGDHRIAMMGAIAGLVSENGIRVKNVECVETSFPGFAQLLVDIGAKVEELH